MDDNRRRWYITRGADTDASVSSVGLHEGVAAHKICTALTFALALALLRFAPLSFFTWWRKFSAANSAHENRARVRRNYLGFSEKGPP